MLRQVPSPAALTREPSPAPSAGGAAASLGARLAPDLASIAVLLLAAHRLDGAALSIALALAGAALVARRAVLGVRVSGHRDGKLRTPGTSELLVSATTTLLLGVALLMSASAAVVAPVLALVAGDIAPVLAGRAQRRRGGSADTDGSDGTPAPKSFLARRRLVAAAPSALIGAMHILVLAGVLRSSRAEDATLLAALTVLGLVPFVAAGTVPALLVAGLTAGRRISLAPALLLGGGLGSLATLVILGAPNRLVGVSDPRLAALAPYVAVAMALLGVAQLLVHHGVAVGRAGTPLAIALLAAGTQVVLVLVGTGPPAEVAVDAALGGAAVLLIGLSLATVVAAPFAFTLRAEHAGDGPRLVGWSLLGLSALGLAVRLASMRPLWIDEAATARLVEGSFLSMLQGGLAADAHPPLYLGLAWASRRVFGEGALALRLPSLVAGTLIVPLVYVAGKELYGRRTGLIAGAVAAFAPPLVWFSVEARPTAVVAFLSVASLLAALRAVRLTRPSDWVLLGLAEAALLWAHQLAVVHLAVIAVAVVASLWRAGRNGEDARPWLPLAGAAGALAIVLFAAVPLVAARSGLGPPRVLPPLEFATQAAPGEGTSVFPLLGTGMTALLGFHPANVTSRLLALWPLGILAALLVLGRARSRGAVLLLALAGAPFAALFLSELAGVQRRPAFALGWAATALPMLALLMGGAIGVLAGPWRKARLVTAGLATLLLVALADQVVRVKPEARFDVRPALQDVAQQADADDLVAYEPSALGDLVRYEVKGTDAEPIEQVVTKGTGGDRVYVVAAPALGGGQESLERALNLVRDLAASRPLLEERGTPHVKVWVFGALGADQAGELHE